MSMKAVIGLVLALGVVGGSAWYLMTMKPGETAGTPSVQEAKGMGTFSELMMRAGSWKCTVTTSIEEAPSTGTVYVSDGKVRADFVSKPAAMGGAEVKSSMIQADGFVYTWSDAYPQGMKLPVPSSSDPAVSEATAFDYTQQVDYDCGPWMADGALFTPPAEISFMDPGQFMPPTPDTMPALPEGVPMPY